MCSRVWLPCETRDHSLLWVNNTKYVDTRLQLACVFFFQISCCSFSRIPRYSDLSRMWWTTTERWQTSPSLATIQSMEQRVCLSHAHTAWIAFGLQLSISLFLFPSIFKCNTFSFRAANNTKFEFLIFLGHALLTVVLFSTVQKAIIQINNIFYRNHSQPAPPPIGFPHSLTWLWPTIRASWMRNNTYSWLSVLRKMVLGDYEELLLVWTALN